MVHLIGINGIGIYDYVIRSDMDVVDCGKDYMLFYTGLIRAYMVKSFRCYQIALF